MRAFTHIAQKTRENFYEEPILNIRFKQDASVCSPINT